MILALGISFVECPFIGEGSQRGKFVPLPGSGRFNELY